MHISNRQHYCGARLPSRPGACSCSMPLLTVNTYCRLAAASGYFKARDHSGCGNDLPLISPPVHSRATISSVEVGEICLLLSNACCLTSSRGAASM